MTYRPFIICFFYLAGIVTIVEAGNTDIVQAIGAFLVGFAYFLGLELPMILSGYIPKKVGFFRFLRPLYITIPIVIVYKLAYIGLNNMPGAIHAIGAFAFIAAMSMMVYKAHVMHAFVHIDASS